MSLLRKAVIEQAAAKVGIFGKQGSGKTTTATLIALGLSKTFHNSAPIAFFDTENGSDYVLPILEAEGVEMLVLKSRAFADMRQAEREAKAAGCCVFLADSYTHPWTELLDSFKKKTGRNKIEFHQQQAIKGLWTEWTDQMLGSQMHMLLCGRLGFDWDREEDEVNEDTGKVEKGDLVKLGSKMKGEGDAGYEPSLLIEIEALQDTAGREKRTRSKRSSISHYAYVLKDRWRTLNGQKFTFRDINAYKVGDYKRVFDAFRPHFDKLAIGKTTQRAVDATRTSQALFGARDSAEFGRRKDIALEEIKESIVAVWPGQTAAEKKCRQVILEQLFGTLAWSKVETKKLDELEATAVLLKQLRAEAVKQPEMVTSEPGIIALLQLSKDALNELPDNTPIEDDVPAPREVPVI